MEQLADKFKHSVWAEQFFEDAKVLNTALNWREVIMAEAKVKDKELAV